MALRFDSKKKKQKKLKCYEVYMMAVLLSTVGRS